MGKKKVSLDLVLITGGSSGIGLALAKKFAQLGSKIIIVGRNKDKLTQAIEKISRFFRDTSQEIIPLQADVSQHEVYIPLLTKILNTVGVPDIVVNSAGITKPAFFNDISMEEFQKIIDVNYLGTVATIKAVLPAMLKRDSGTIVNISSVAGFIGTPGYTAYGASKFAIKGLTDALRLELLHSGVNVSIVYPPDTQTPMLEEENKIKPALVKALSEAASPVSAEEVAETILAGITKQRYVIAPGKDTALLHFLAGFLGWGPIYPIMDWMLRDAERKVTSHPAKYAHNDITNPNQRR